MELYALSECYDVGIRETCLENSHYWKTTTDGYKVFQKDRKGRGEGGIALYVKEKIECMRLSYGDHRSSIEFL